VKTGITKNAFYEAFSITGLRQQEAAASGLHRKVEDGLGAPDLNYNQMETNNARQS
jgi:hypothetical protein